MDTNLVSGHRLLDLPFSEFFDSTPKQLGYYFPAEFDLHIATWLSWPHKEASWPGKIDTIFPRYAEFIKYLSLSEKVRINVLHEKMRDFALEYITNAGAELNNVEF